MIQSIKKIIKYLKDYNTDNFKSGFFLSVCLFLIVTLFINYKIEFENSFLDSYFGNPIQVFFHFIFYSFPYYSTCMLYSFFYKKYDFWKEKGFWVISIFGILTISLNGSLYLHRYLTDIFFADETKSFFNKCLKNAFSSAQLFIFLFIFYKFFDKEKSKFYGFTTKGFDFKPYLLMLVLMFPLIFWASFRSDFLTTYPTYRPGQAESYWNVSSFFTIMVYELFYGFDFAFVELLFRGFMVIGMSRWLGAGAIFPMCTMYCFLHFGKPPVEAISSIFGGYLLGIIAYYSRSIFGGIMIHIGIALMMEVLAFWQINS